MQQKGQNLIEFLIILLLVVIVAIFALTLLGGNIFTLFTKVSDFNPFNQTEDTISNTPLDGNTDVNPPAIATGPLGGTADNPVSQCVAGKCTLDFGEYVLTGIPENFGEIVKTTGSSGGTESLLSLMNQIADQLEDKGDINGATDYRQLANLGHFIAEVQKTNETAIKNCGGSGYDANLCYYNLRNQSANISLPPELSSVLPNYKPADYLSAVTNQTDLGTARNEALTDPNPTPLNDPTASPAAAFISLFDKIMDNDNYSTQMRGITQELYLNIADIGAEHRRNDYMSDYLMGSLLGGWSDPKGAYGGMQFGVPIPALDPLTGENLGDVYYQGDSGTLGRILTPPASVDSNLNSALICATGWNKDTGSNCHK